ncbi:Response regulator with CheY-like receiver domain and winged-helix DNA-binding domain [Candidatus Desulfosporosinus infrequens]|uniref:Stage 0 sporulation protein A homolog n=1 Tax=Candidatus Desulfosporosinus infrequens TaxID=2043169 RepID=A0A2U3LBV0_9FIRM|nr:Response regulator with CheY-like receiver domain and winged-helix DNA-binding domain [Candidatus Desulfosporosinus infrequens]
MKILIAEDDLASRRFLSKFLAQFGEVDLVVDGIEALDAYLMAIKEEDPYDLICLDIMMPKVDGVKVLKAIRDFEAKRGVATEQRVKVIMTTALAETEFVNQAFEIGCEAYAAKPIDTNKMFEVIQKLGLIEGN